MGSRDRSRSRDRRRSRSRERSRRWDRSRSRDRDRDRDRDRRRSRSKSRSRSRDRNKSSGALDASISAVQAMAALQQQQQLQRQLLAQQMLLQQQAAAAAAAAALSKPAMAQQSTTAATADRKSREIYVGNLAIGVVTADMLKELFNTILANQVADPVSTPPVVNVNLDPSAGRFAFIEFRTRELTDAAIQLDKLELCGRQMNIGRPKGYVDPNAHLVNAAKLGQAQVALATAQFALPGAAVPGALPGAAAALPGALPGLAGAAGLAGLMVTTPTAVVLLENMVTCATIRDDTERKEILDDVRSEVVKCGAVVGLAAPMPPAHVTNADAARVYVKFSSADEAGRCRNMMDGRKFDDNSVRAIFVTEAEFLRAQAGEWVGKPGLLLDPAAAAAPALAGLAAPGLAGLAGLGAAAAAAPAAAAPAAGGLALPPGFTLPPGFSIAGALPGLGLPK
ncbi:hypothetical protein HYH02_008503 [Chlamydomonas schloesseri]|uniref:RRM domain-containing protein n=1 Tax=Chlamydomonas schloesseri TaxID=2026947 RepID=A0A836B3Q4_9CHLO|nr:hypothetical protein HYH02_008503 [Chlamydomonas schloesseri]|eukprot:KAG2446513.1 hypothetical protein HYH02_008503 [Chlamydomonas schloesseri]